MEQRMTREQLLAVDPAALLADGLRGAPALDDTGLRDELRTTGALVLSEQVRLAGIAPEALAACAVTLDQARDRLPPDGTISDEERRRTWAGLALQCHGYPEVLPRWINEIFGRVAGAADLGSAIRLLERALDLWRLNDTLREANARTRSDVDPKSE